MRPAAVAVTILSERQDASNHNYYNHCCHCHHHCHHNCHRCCHHCQHTYHHNLDLHFYHQRHQAQYSRHCYHTVWKANITLAYFHCCHDLSYCRHGALDTDLIIIPIIFIYFKIPPTGKLQMHYKTKQRTRPPAEIHSKFSHKYFPQKFSPQFLHLPSSPQSCFGKTSSCCDYQLLLCQKIVVFNIWKFSFFHFSFDSDIFNWKMANAAKISQTMQLMVSMN